MTVLEHKQELDTIKLWLKQGAITYKRAEALAKPHLDAMNEKSKEIAKRLHTKAKLFNFSSYIR